MFAALDSSLRKRLFASLRLPAAARVRLRPRSIALEKSGPGCRERFPSCRSSPPLPRAAQESRSLADAPQYFGRSGAPRNATAFLFLSMLPTLVGELIQPLDHPRSAPGDLRRATIVRATRKAQSDFQPRNDVHVSH